MRACWMIGLTLNVGLAGCSGQKPKPESVPDPTPATVAEAPKAIATGSGKPKDELVWNGKHLTVWITDLDAADPDVRVMAADALREHYGPRARGAAPGLARLLKDKYVPVRASAARTLAELGPDAREGVPALIEAFQHDKDKDVRLLAGVALIRLGADAKSALPAFIQAIDDPETQIRVEAVNALAVIDPQDRDAQAALIKALRDHDDTVGKVAIMALVEQVGETAVAALTETIKGSDVKAATRSARALSLLGPKARPAVATLSQTLRITPRENLELRVRLAETLGVIGLEAREAVPILIEALRDDDYRLRIAATTALIHIGPESDAVPKLVAILKEDNSPGRTDAAKVLTKIGKPAVAPLVEVLSSTNAEILLPAIGALADIGPDARPAVTKLGFLLKDEDETVKKAAVQALRKIDPAEAKKLGV